jgi:hypothetical protein
VKLNAEAGHRMATATAYGVMKGRERGDGGGMREG